MENLQHRLRKMKLRWFGHVKPRIENSILRRGMELEVEGKRPVGRSKKICRKVVEEDMRKLKIMEGMAEDRKQWKQLVSCLTPGVGSKLGTINDDDDDDDDDEQDSPHSISHMVSTAMNLGEL